MRWFRCIGPPRGAVVRGFARRRSHGYNESRVGFYERGVVRMFATSRLLCVIVTALMFTGCGNKGAVPAPPEAKTPAPKTATAPAPSVPDLTEAVKAESPDFGVLTVKVPGGGQTALEKSAPGNPAATAVVKYGSGLVSQLQITALGPLGITPDFGKDASLKRELENWAAVLKGKTVETELAPILFDSEPVHGYYVSATDANPAAGQPKYLVNGFFRASTGVFMMGVLSDDAPGAMAEFLAVAKTAQWEGKPAPAGATAKPDEPQPAGK